MKSTAKGTLAREMMSRPVRRLTARTPVRDAAEFLTRHGISGAPVEDEHGRWLGVFSTTDLGRAVASRMSPPAVDRTLEAREPVPPLPQQPSLESLGCVPVSDLMTAGLVTVFPDSTIDEVLRSMLHFKVHRVFVIDAESGALEGVITTVDILRWLEVSRDPSTAIRGARDSS
ncbi:MAG: CBS domain-containing protein [Planctomycetaceae bacterium]|nr:CBS domain-containing protein [Planctomycetaceae bacterium]